MTRLIEILISLAIVAVLFVAVALVLPSSRSLSESVETNRKMTIVYDTVNSLRRFKDWNPLVLRDPKVQLKLSGPDAGVGARLDYVSEVPSLGEGSWEIVESEPNKRVAYDLVNNERGSNKRTEFILEPTGRNNRNVKITQTYKVDYGFNLLGRYNGLYVGSSIGDDLKLGLARMSNMLASVPNYDYAEFSRNDPSMTPKVSDRPAENLLVVTAVVPRDNAKVQAQMQGNMEWIEKVIKANGLQAVGPVRIITNEFGSESYSFDVAQAVTKEGVTGPIDVDVEGPVEAKYVEAAKIAVVPAKGHMAGLPVARDSLRAWVLTRGYETIERPYELWKAGIPAGFTENGEYDVVWAIK